MSMLCRRNDADIFFNLHHIHDAVSNDSKCKQCYLVTLYLNESHNSFEQRCAEKNTKE